MALIEFECEKCGFVTEELVKSDGVYPACSKCGGKLKQRYSGKCVFGTAKHGGCSGNCKTCGGCH